MGGSAPGKGSVADYPAPPNPYAAAGQQSQMNYDTALQQRLLNQTNQVTPYGTSTYAQTGTTRVGNRDVPNYTQTISLSPQEQALYNARTGIGQQLLDVTGERLPAATAQLGTPLDLSNLPKTLSQEYGADPRQRVEDALYQRYASRLDPEYELRQKQLESQLVNQGFSRNSEAYNRAFDQFNRSRNDAYSQAREQAIVGGGAEQSRESALRIAEQQQALQTLLAGRETPYNELAAAYGLAPTVTNAQYAAPPQTAMSPTDYLGAVLGSGALEQQGYSTRQQGIAAQNAGLGQLASSAALAYAAYAMSDPKSKTDKRPHDDDETLKAVRGLPVESWRYKGDDQRRVGPYADDWAKKFGGDGHVIPLPQAFGVTLSAIKALAHEVDELKRRAA